jgi:hypothetical protein
MKDGYEVLRQKEAELARTRHEIDCLRIAAPASRRADFAKSKLPERRLGKNKSGAGAGFKGESSEARTVNLRNR